MECSEAQVLSTLARPRSEEELQIDCGHSIQVYHRIVISSLKTDFSSFREGIVRVRSDDEDRAVAGAQSGRGARRAESIASSLT